MSTIPAHSPEGRPRRTAAVQDTVFPASRGSPDSRYGLGKPVSRHIVVLSMALALSGFLAGLAGPASAAQAASPGTGGTLTCFAIDVSGSNAVASDGEPPSDPGPIFVRKQVVELYDEIISDLGEAADQRVGVVTFGTSSDQSPSRTTPPARSSRPRCQAPSGRHRPRQRGPAGWRGWPAASRCSSARVTIMAG